MKLIVYVLFCLIFFFATVILLIYSMNIQWFIKKTWITMLPNNNSTVYFASKTCTFLLILIKYTHQSIIIQSVAYFIQWLRTTCSTTTWRVFFSNMWVARVLKVLVNIKMIFTQGTHILSLQFLRTKMWWTDGQGGPIVLLCFADKWFLGEGSLSIILIKFKLLYTILFVP